jgi:putative zinc finger/helix-turn-helix YgiT family protein
MFCSACGTISYRGAQISEHERAVARAIRETHRLLSPEELSRIRAKYRFTESDMESILSTGPKTWTRWEQGKVTQSPATDKLIRAMADDPDLARRFMEQAGVINKDAEAFFDEIQRKERQLARDILRAELRDYIGFDLEDMLVEKVLETVRNARQKGALAQAA